MVKERKIYLRNAEAKAARIKTDALWERALLETTDKLRLKDKDEIIERLQTSSHEAHGIFRYKLILLVVEDLVDSIEGVNNVWLYGSVDGSSENIKPNSDIDLIIEVAPSEEIREKAHKYFELLNTRLTGNFNQIMEPTGISFSGKLIDVSSKIFLPQEIAEGKGFSVALKSRYDPVSSLYRKPDAPQP